MKLLPYHTFEIRTKLRPEEVRGAITSRTEAVDWLRFTWPSTRNDHRFEGEVTGAQFSVRRVLGYRNSFKPQTTGEIHADGRGSRIVIRMRLMVVTFVFLAFWCVPILGLSIGALSGAIAPPVVLIAIPMVLFIYLLTMGGFWYEANKQERALREIFQGEPPPH